LNCFPLTSYIYLPLLWYNLLLCSSQYGAWHHKSQKSIFSNYVLLWYMLNLRFSPGF
jgi:hypothetical protein